MEDLIQNPHKKHKRLIIPPKRRRFVAEYLKDFNGTEAAKRAGYSPNSAYAQSSYILKRVEIQQEIETALQKRMEVKGITRDRVLTEIARLAFGDTRKLFNDEGTLKMPSEWDDETAAAVAGIEVTEEYGGRGEDRALTGYTKKVKQWEKTRALELLGRHLKLFGDKNGDNGDKPAPILLISIRNRNGEKQEIKVSGG